MKRILLLLSVSVLALGTALQAPPARAAGLTITVDPTPAAVRVGSTLYVTGTAPLLHTVVLQLQRGGVWTTISTPSGSGARFAFAVPTSYYGTRILRVISPPGLLGEIDGAPFAVRVLPPYAPAGYSSQYRLVGNGFRWNPCAAVRYHVNVKGVPARSNLHLIRQALTRVTLATGIRFVYAGRTTKVPFSRNWYHHTPAAGLYLGWAVPKQVKGLRGLIGLGGESRLTITAMGNRMITTGGVVLQRNKWPHLRPGWRKGAARGSLLLHEIGHAMGLTHVGTKAETMYPNLGRWTRSRYAAGDLTGLQRLGLDQGCLV